MSGGGRRLDQALQERGLASTRGKAQDLIRSGSVRVNGKIIQKTGHKVEEQDELVLLAPENPFVSRGGLKLAAALDEFAVSPMDKRCLDLGISTGGFTDCLLQKGAEFVVGVDVGSGQLSPKLAGHPRIRLHENMNVKNLSPDKVGAEFDLIVVDLSFISLLPVLPVLPGFLKKGGHVILLVKPQFEVGKENVGSGGVVRSENAKLEAVRRVRTACEALSLTEVRVIPSPILGGDGNQEFLLHARDSRQ